METIDLLTQCIEQNQIVEFTYKKKNGTVGQYIVEPHEIRNGYLFAWDPRVQDHDGSYKGGIKQFIVAGIVNPLVTQKNFTKRFAKKEE